MSGINFDIQATEPDTHELLENERNRRLDELVRAWFMYVGLEMAGNMLSEQALSKYLALREIFKNLHDKTSDEYINKLVRDAKAEMFYGELAVRALGHKG